MSAHFGGLGGYQANPVPPATSGDLDRTYDDGYNRRDIGPVDGLTWNWGYDDYPRQISGDSLLLSVSSAKADGVSRENDADPLHGFEVTYQRRISKDQKWHWGIESAFNHTHLEINDAGTVLGTVTTITDAYPLNPTGIYPPGTIVPPVIIPPHAPSGTACAGTYAGPGALIGDTPTSRTAVTVPDGAVTTGRRDWMRPFLVSI